MNFSTRNPVDLSSLSLHDRFSIISDFYAWFDPQIKRRHPYSITPYQVDWNSVFTPIENRAWGLIRLIGLPLYPQYPASKYFLDFGDPVNNIGLEVDGGQWHDEQKDKKRDDELLGLGWRIYRVSGAKCMKLIDNPFWDDLSGMYVSDEIVETWFNETLDGVIYSIAVNHYDWQGISPNYRELTYRILGQHKLADFDI